MSPKLVTKYLCQQCGYLSPRWIGKCPNCNEWNTFVEEVVESKRGRKQSSVNSNIKPVSINDVQSQIDIRIFTSIGEFDRVVGGGIVTGSVVLIGGDPGIGKSTLMLQIAEGIQLGKVLYVTGEESIQQIKLRMQRLTKSNRDIKLLAETNLEIIREVIEREMPSVVIIDSIQTMYYPQLESAPGSISQVRESTALITSLAKEKNISVLLVGHVTKDGTLAGPRVIEHMVDTVLQFEGERHYAYRILRSLKNRYGSTNEIGIFEMRDNGLREVSNPSEIFLANRSNNVSGSAVVATLEGTRPLLVEVQALVTPTNYGMPQRTVTGFDLRRLQMLLAVLEKRLGYRMGAHDVFVNVAGGIRIDEPAADLGIISAVVSSLTDKPISQDYVIIGEVGLGGEIRTVAQMERRILEAEKLGFKKIIIPQQESKTQKFKKIEVIGISNLKNGIELIVK
ncbi:MAG: DNA repair protein RadA [Ignavibacteria bacterium]|nr:DNA repair protein RadA [Bacteroidota bacterium]MSQ45887.1 DNA repair protein RadA [Ignavibacteria bacterium]